MRIENLFERYNKISYIKIRISVMALLLAVAAPVLSQQPVVDPAAVAIQHFKDGNSLLSACQANPRGTFQSEQFYADAMQSSYCLGYIGGAVDADSMARFYSPGAPRICLGDATVNQIRDLVVRTLVKHPEVRHYSAGFIVVSVLQEAFPCPK
jgi:hypothetical protein